MPTWLTLLRPNLKRFHPSRMLLGAMAFGLPIAWLVHLNANATAGMMGFAILATLMMDMGETRWQRLESMVLGTALLLLCGGLSMLINQYWLLWIGGIVLLISLIGSSLTAGFALDLKLRMCASAYLIGYPGSIVTSEILPWYLLGAMSTIALSIGFAPRLNNPAGLENTPFWRKDFKMLKSGQFAGVTFGVLLALACASSFFLAHQMGMQAPNIAAICTVMVFRPEPSRTKSTIWLRLVGVVLASVLAWLIIFPVHSSQTLVWMIIIAGALVPVAFANGLMYVAALSTFIIYIILALLGLHGHAAQIAAENRIVETLLGAFIAAVFAMIYQSLSKEPSSQPS